MGSTKRQRAPDPSGPLSPRLQESLARIARLQEVARGSASEVGSELDAGLDEIRRTLEEFQRGLEASSAAAEEARATTTALLESLRKERNFAERLLETAQAIVLVLDSGGRIVRFNPYLERIAGYRLEEVKGKDWFATFLPSRDRRQIRSLFSTAVAGVPVRGNVNPIVAKNGSERVIEWYDSRIRDDEGNVVGLLCMGLDITERMQAEEALRASRERLRHSERLASVGILAAGLAHEINNPIGAILLAAGHGLESLDRPNALAVVQECLRDIAEDARRCGHIVKRVLQFSRDQTSEKRPEAIPPVVHQAIDLVRPDAGRHAATLEVSLSPGLPRVVMNSTEIEQVLVNVIRNAVESGGGRGVRVSVRGECRDGWVCITVRDDGRGLNDEAKRHLFDPFYTTRRAMGGTGLGLSISHGIVTDHGGSIEVESEVGEGTTFTVTLPTPEKCREDGGADGEDSRRG